MDAGGGGGKTGSRLPVAPEYDDHSRLLVYRDAQGRVRPVESAWDWGVRRSHILGNMQRVMGPLPEPHRRVPLDIQVLGETRTPHYLRREITFASESGDRVPAYLLLPAKPQGPSAAMLCLHPTSPLGKDQVCGLGG